MQVVYTQSHFFNSFFAILIEEVWGKFCWDQHTAKGEENVFFTQNMYSVSDVSSYHVPK